MRDNCNNLIGLKKIWGNENIFPFRKCTFGKQLAKEEKTQLT